MTDSGSVTAVIVAGGRGARLGLDLPKPLIPLGRRPLVSYSLQTFEDFPGVSGIILVCGEEWLNQARRLAKRWSPTKLIAVVEGGSERPDSVRAGLTCLPDRCTIVAIHDAARPFVKSQTIQAAFDRLKTSHGAVPGLPLADTLRRWDNGTSSGCVDRTRYVLCQTPQCFHREVLEEALRRAERDNFTGTDDVSYVERLPGARIAITEGDPENFKITLLEDLERARYMVSQNKRHRYRCGEGFDAHRFTVGRPLILGGVTIPYELGLHGHSDADVLCHAIGDALLGSASLGDLGTHFPDTDPAYQGISSIILLEKIRDMLTARNITLSSVDATLVLQMPRIAPHRGKIIASLARALKMPAERVSVKATTTEGMGPEGRGEGITCRAVVMVWEKG